VSFCAYANVFYEVSFDLILGLWSFSIHQSISIVGVWEDLEAG